MATPTSRAVPVARSELRTRTALVLEAIALRHQIAVLERSRTRRPCFRRWDRLLWVLLSRWWPQWQNFCHYIHFFRSRKDGEAWIAKTPGTFILSLDEATDLARRKNQLQFGPVP